MDRKKRVSCVIVNYNDADTTEKLVRQIFRYRSLDGVVVVDNGSTDGSEGRLRALAKELTGEGAEKVLLQSRTGKTLESASEDQAADASGIWAADRSKSRTGQKSRRRQKDGGGSWYWRQGRTAVTARGITWVSGIPARSWGWIMCWWPIRMWRSQSGLWPGSPGFWTDIRSWERSRPGCRMRFMESSQMAGPS